MAKEEPFAMKLLNRIAVVTGAASGIGGRAAVRLAGEGAKLFLMDVNPDGLEATRSEILASGGEAIACPCDVSDEAAVKAAVMQAMDAYGRIDILVNVAGVQITKLLADTTKADYDKMMDINLGGTFLTMHEILPIMKKQGSGAIVNCASELAFVGYHELAVYTATKGAMISLSRSAALSPRLCASSIARPIPYSSTSAWRTSSSGSRTCGSRASSSAAAPLNPSGRCRKR